MNITSHLIEQGLWQSADRFNELYQPGSRFFFQDSSMKYTEVKTQGWAFVCGDSLLIRVSGVVGAVPVDVLTFAGEGTTVCPVCEGFGSLPEAVQAWDCGQEPPDCSFCSEGIMNLDQQKLYFDAATTPLIP